MNLSARLLALKNADIAVRSELAASGELFAGYHPRMRAVHEANARELELLVDDEGWPGVDVAGEDGAEAAWLVAMHAISRPAFMRRCLGFLRAAANRGEVPGYQVALLDDRIRTLEGRPQRYGTQFDWDAAGLLTPLPIEDEAEVDARRAALGLPPLAEAIAAARAAAEADGEPPPEEWEARYRRMDEFAKEVGWR